MKITKTIATWMAGAAIAGAMLFAAPQKAEAQSSFSFGVTVGNGGYYTPYPYGYYGHYRPYYYSGYSGYYPSYYGYYSRPYYGYHGHSYYEHSVPRGHAYGHYHHR